ncbi:MAG TPA: D-alanine--D-alanine ligase, partial [Candidatus Portnoybacteria bacterium]|nr:D-alanine--D-alanine ligase [Candidatus Portnoybacteria bacterium]
MRKLNLGILMGGKSAEHEVSLATGKNIIKSLNKKKYNIWPVKITKENQWTLKGRTLPIDKIAQKIDIAFIALHGEYGEDGTIQGLCESLGLPYTGSGVLASALGMDKSRSRELFKTNGLLVPRDEVLSKGETGQSVWQKLSPPWVIKPNSRGSSVGISIVKNKKDLAKAIKDAFQYDQRIIIEEYLDGLEITCGVLDNFKGKPAFTLPITEICPAKKYQFFNYEAKYKKGATEEITPARISRKATGQAQEIALKAYQILGCQGYSRADMIKVGQQIYLLEVNTLPGMTENSLYPRAA